MVYMKQNKTDVCVIGGGAAGLAAAAFSSLSGKSVTLVEKNNIYGKKLNITGKGRCNLTNNCTAEEFFAGVVTNPKFLYAAINKFPPSELMRFFESEGVSLVTEQGRRVFPASMRARDITGCLVSICRREGVVFRRGRVCGIATSNAGVTGIEYISEQGKDVIECGRVILACGGASYPATGSDGKSYALAEALGHTIIETFPSLVPLEASGNLCQNLMGLSLKNTGVSFIDNNGKVLFYEVGEMIFTHFGVSGPVILSASCHLRNKFPCIMSLDLKPGLDYNKLDKRVCRDFEENHKRSFAGSLGGLLPTKLIQPIVSLSGIPAEKKVHDITKEERKRLVTLLKDLRVEITGTRPFSEAIITSGGVKTSEINPSTMESKLVKGLYFAGEVIDVDAYTGGYNLQIAFSTAFLASGYTNAVIY